ncbi:MAG: dihydrofolate reductase [Candidatus Glassbacteria bacterium]|nr:dihydrofolate reductase [Candidatus Glassbacteria bacterium]
MLPASCGGPTAKQEDAAGEEACEKFQYVTEQFADLRILRYRVTGFDQLDIKQKTLAYYLYEAALSGREITFDQNYKHNLCIRRTLENIYRTYSGRRSGELWDAFVVYLKRIWFSSGVHHHYSSGKFEPGFSREYFAELASGSDAAKFPLEHDASVEALVARLAPLIFDPAVDPKGVNLSPAADLVAGSANNFYENVTQAEAEAFYEKMIDRDDPTPISYGLNSKLVKEDGKLVERTWRVGGMYGAAIERIVFWLERAAGVAENETQKAAFEKLVEYYRTGDLRTFDEYNIIWVRDTSGVLDVINGFIETYGDAMGYRATFESVVQLTDFEATRRIDAIAEEVQWFEDNSPLIEEHKKPDVSGISARVVNTVVGAGAVSPSSPIGINLPNANWIRANHGSKSVTLGNIVNSFNEAGKSSGEVEEFYLRDETRALIKQHGVLADNLHTDMHEVIGHASGRIEPGVGTPRETLKNYAATLEEARADLVALYYLPDPKLVEIGVAPTTDIGKVAYDGYITNGLIRQLRRIEPGEELEEAHMRNRQLVALWAWEQGRADNVIERVEREGKTYFVVNDYGRLRELFGRLLREIQRIKSQGDYEAGKALVETYGVKVDEALRAQVVERYKKLGIAPYSGFINPRLVPVERGGEIVDVRVEYPEDFTEQMLYYADKYSFLPTYN